jgi:membrane associated rhomboid family serine protease
MGRILIGLLCSIAALIVSFYLGSLFLLLFDSNYHDGFAAVGGLIIGLIVAVVAFRAVVKRRTPSLDHNAEN